MLGTVDAPPVAESLPERYRQVLDRIADLEVAGHRLAADGVRRAAIRAYSGSWNERTALRLEGLATRAERLLATAPSADRSARRPAGIRAVITGPVRAARRLIGRGRSGRRPDAAVPAALTPERPAA